MNSTIRFQRRYDHRLRNLVRSSGDIGHAIRRGVPRSTARGWLTGRNEVVSVDVLDMDMLMLQEEVLKLRHRVEKLSALLRLVVVLLKVSGFSLTKTRLPDGVMKISLLGAIDQSRSVLSLKRMLRSRNWSLSMHYADLRGMPNSAIPILPSV